MKMMGGYSIFEGIFKSKKELFLKEKMNNQDATHYKALKFSLYMFMAINIIVFWIILSKGYIPKLTWIFVGATVLNAVSRQWYRQYLLIKYGYERKESLIKNIIFILKTLVSFLVVIYGLIKLFLYISQF